MIDITIVLESRAFFFSKLPSALHCGYPMFPVLMRKAWFLHFLTFLIDHLLMNSSKGVFEWCSSTESETYSLFICLDTTTFRTLSVFALLETICPKFCAKPLLLNAKSPLLVEVHRSNFEHFLGCGLVSLTARLCNSGLWEETPFKIFALYR